MVRKVTILHEHSLLGYFSARLNEVSEALRPPPHEDTVWYLSDMLSRLAHSENLYNYEEGSLCLRPLALMYQDAREAEDRHERCLILRQLGDISLFLGALFPESYARRGIQKSYFIGMGGGAYDYLAENAKHQRHVFSELASMFTRILEVVAEACSKTTVVDASDIIQLYQRWLHSKDPLIENQLIAIGITPVDSFNTH